MHIVCWGIGWYEAPLSQGSSHACSSVVLRYLGSPAKRPHPSPSAPLRRQRRGCQPLYSRYCVHVGCVTCVRLCQIGRIFRGRSERALALLSALRAAHPVMLTRPLCWHRSKQPQSCAPCPFHLCLPSFPIRSPKSQSPTHPSCRRLPPEETSDPSSRGTALGPRSPRSRGAWHGQRCIHYAVQRRGFIPILSLFPLHRSAWLTISRNVFHSREMDGGCRRRK